MKHYVITEEDFAILKDAHPGIKPKVVLSDNVVPMDTFKQQDGFLDTLCSSLSDIFRMCGLSKEELISIKLLDSGRLEIRPIIFDEVRTHLGVVKKLMYHEVVNGLILHIENARVDFNDSRTLVRYQILRSILHNVKKTQWQKNTSLDELAMLHGVLCYPVGSISKIIDFSKLEDFIRWKNMPLIRKSRIIYQYDKAQRRKKLDASKKG